LKKLLDYVLRIKYRQDTHDPSIVSVAKLCLLTFPQNTYIRFLCNCVYYHNNEFHGVFRYEEHSDSLDNQIFELFGQRSSEALSESEKLTKVKRGLIQDPNNPLFNELINDYRDNYQLYEQKTKDIEQDTTDPQDIWEKLTTLKTTILVNNFDFSEGKKAFV
jgi:hypothetical protein